MWPFIYDRVNPATQKATTTTTKKHAEMNDMSLQLDKEKGVNRA
jgi:hypothetical protein